MSPSEQQNRELVDWLKHQSAPFARRLNGIVGASVLAFAVKGSALFVLAGALHDLVIEKQPVASAPLALLATLFAAQVLLQGFIHWRKRSLASAVLEHFQGGLWQRLQHDSLALIREHSMAAWQSFFLKRVAAFQGYYSDYLPQQRLAAITPLLVLLMVLPFSWVAALLLGVAAPLIPLFMWIVGKSAAALQRKQFVAMERLSSIFLDRLQARQLLHVHAAVDAQKQLFRHAAISLRERTLQVLRVAFLSTAVLDFFATIGMALVAVFVGFSLLGEIAFGSWESGLTFHEGLFLLLLAPLFFSELKLLGRYYHLRAEAIGAADALRDILHTRRESANVASDLAIDLRNLRVLSADAKPLLHAERVVLRPGDHVLLQGASGAGKTTLLEALLGLRDLQADTRQCLPRAAVGWLDQFPVILPDSVRINLNLGTHIEDEYLLEALQAVELLDWLEQLSEGLDTPLGDYPPLSGGQKQRLAIARLMLFDKPVVFLDEPTAHLGSAQSQRVTTLLQRAFADKTLVWVAHDLEKSEFFNARWWLDEKGKLHSCREENRLCA